MSGLSEGVLIIVENLPLPFDRRVWQEATALQRAGYTVSIICPKGRGYDLSYEQIDGVHIYRHPLPLEASSGVGFLMEYSVALFWQAVLSVKVARRHGFTIIHGCNPPDLCFLVALGHKLFRRTRFVFDHHDICPELYEAKFNKRGLVYRLLLLAERLTFRTASVCISTNECFRKIAIERGRVPPDRVFVVKSYPELSRFYRTSPDDALKRRWRHLVGYVGIIASQDGVDRLIQAMAHIVGVKGRDEVGCVIVGDGPELENLKALAVALKIENNVIFTGYLKGDALLYKLSSIDIGVIPDPPNTYNDKISMNKVFEYMALGIPFVHYDLAQCNRESGKAAETVMEDSPAALAEAILNLLPDRERREQMGAYGRKRAEQEFRWDKEVPSLLAAYDAIRR